MLDHPTLSLYIAVSIFDGVVIGPDCREKLSYPSESIILSGGTLTGINLIKKKE